MYRFYQVKEGKCEWLMVPDDKDNLAQLAAQNTPLITILAVSENPETAEDLDKLKYKGDFYLDIDRSDIGEAIVDVRRVIKVLRGHGVEGFELFCSGSKGFHVIVPAKMFSTNRPSVHLNLIYKEMAMCIAGEANAEGVDLVVYSGGKGRMLRQANVLRKNGKYKVPITLEELDSITPETYQELVSAPRATPDKIQAGKAVGMATLFSASADKVKRMIKHSSSMVGMEKEELKAINFDTGCIKKLIEIGDEKADANFNRVAMVLAAFIKDKGYSKEEYEPVLKQAAANIKSSTYRKPGVRYKHLIGILHTALSNKRMKFTQQYLYSVINPCRECALCKKQIEEEEAAAESAEIDASGLRIDNFKYVKGRDEEARTVTNFTITVDKVYMQFDPELRRYVREKSDVTLVHAAGETPVTLEDECFISKNALSKAIVGVSNLVVKGNDMDVIAIKEHVFSKTGDSEVIYSADKYGLMEVTNEANGTKYLVYVEPHFSISMTGALNQYKVAEGQDSFPRLHTAKEIPSPDFMKQIVKSLFSINNSAVVAQVVGWTIASFFKIHMMKRFNGQFPLLHVFGNAGSGKTATVELVSYLHGLDYSGMDSIINLGGGTTPYAVKHSIASSSTVPRVFDEFNAGKVREYAKICELFKACWTSQSMAQGGLVARRGGGSAARVQSVSLSGPVCTIGEQRLEMPALNERVVQVHLRLKDRDQANGGSAKTSFTSLSKRKEFLTSIGRLVMKASLRTSATSVEDKIRVNMLSIPEGLTDRPTYARAVILTGLDLLDEAMSANGIDVTDTVMEAKNSWLRSMEENSAEVIADISRTEVDKVIDFMATVVTFDDVAERGVMRRDYEFMILEGKLLIDFTRSMLIYRRASISAGISPVFQNFAHMQKHLHEEDYFIGYKDMQNTVGQFCKFAQLDIEKLQAKGIDASYFYGNDDVRATAT